MGYTTEFEGQFTVEPPLSPKEIEYLNKFSDTRRMKREAGPYFVDGTGMCGQGHDEDILDHNTPPEGQPGLWCQWIATDDGTAIEWDGGEKFYYAEKWIQYIIDHFFGPNPIAKKAYPEIFDFLESHTFSGTVEAYGEVRDDVWRMRIENGYQVVVDEGHMNIDVADSKPVERQIN